MRAIVAAARSGDLKVTPRLVVSNNQDCPALDFARSEGLPWRHISATTEGGPDAADRAIAAAMDEAGVQLIVLSVYLLKLRPATLRRYRSRILNIHPALLPRYGGQGMYGRRVHDAVLANHDAFTGATVHLVDADYDTGPILAQQPIAVSPQDTAADIERNVMAMEPGLFVSTLRQLAEGSLTLPNPVA